MNHLKKLLLIALVIFARIESSDARTQKRLKPKIQRTNKKIAQEVGQIFATDDKTQIAKEVNDVQLLAKTPEQKQEVAQALQKEIIKETKEIKQELAKSDENKLEYITYEQAVNIIKSKKELSKIKRSSWTDSYIIKPFTKTYRLFLRVWDQQKYAELLEQERKSLEHALNVQAHNNLMLLFVTIDLATKEPTLNLDHMFKKENFYNMTKHAFEGGALCAAEINLSRNFRNSLIDLGVYTEHFLEKIINREISHRPEIIQSIYTMIQIIDQVRTLRSKNIAFIKKIEIKDDFWVKEAFLDTIWIPGTSDIKKLCKKAAEANGQLLIENNESYTQYLQRWISEPKNVAKVGFAIAAIGGLYIYGPAVPAWLKEYSTSSIGSIKGAVSKGYNATISSVKNLWNKLSGNKTQKLPDFKEARIDAQKQGLDVDDYFIQQGSEDAQEIEITKKIEDKIERHRAQLDLESDLSNAFSKDQYDQINQKDDYEKELILDTNLLELKQKREKIIQAEDKRIAELAEKRRIAREEEKAREEEIEEKYRQKQAEKKTEALLLGIQEIQTEDALKQNEQQQGQMLNDFDDEIKSDELAQALAQRNWDADREKALQAEAIEKAKTEE